MAPAFEGRHVKGVECIYRRYTPFLRALERNGLWTTMLHDTQEGLSWKLGPFGCHGDLYRL